MKKYFEVVATQFSREQGKQVEVVVGRFDNGYYASIFKDAYNEEFKSDARVVEYRRVD